MGFFYKKLSTLILFLSPLLLLAQAPQPLNQWVDVNDGFAKCPAIGQSAGVASYDRDNFTVGALLYRQGEAYADIYYDRYGVGSNTQSCSEGFFRHDTISNKWVRVANGYARNCKYVSNPSGIWRLDGGRVYELTYNYASYPTGWKPISKIPYDPLTYSNLWTGNCSPNNRPWESVSFSNDYEADAIGDTIYVLFRSTGLLACPDQTKIGKFSITGRTWNFDVVGRLPNEGITEANGQVNLNEGRMVFTHRIAGLFKYFYSNSRLGLNVCIPYYTWVYDPRTGRWKNISQGVDWTNSTRNSAPCTGGNNWGPNGGMFPSWDRRDIYAASETGIFKWRGDAWQYVAAYGGNANLLPTQTSLFAQTRETIDKIEATNYAPVATVYPIPCVHNSIQRLMSPDDGKTLYIVKDGMKNPGICDYSSGSAAILAISRLKFNPDLPARTRNLHINSGTYLGGPGVNKPVGVGVGARFTVFTAGNHTVVQSRNNAPYRSLNFNGASASSAGRVLRLNKRSDSLISVTNLGAVVHHYQMQNYGDYRMVVSGDFGISVLDSGGSQLWNVPASQIPGSSIIKVDISDDGKVAVIRGQSDNTEMTQEAKLGVFDANGQLLVPFFNIANGNRRASDVCIKGDTVMAVGYQQRDTELDSTACGATIVYDAPEIKVAWVRTWLRTGNQLNVLSNTFDFNAGILDYDLADTKLTHCNVGKDSKFYVLGESAGGNTIYRWNGKQSQEGNGCVAPGRNPLVTSDLYNTAVNAQDNQYAYFAKINPATGYVIKSSFIIPRQSNGRANSYITTIGSIHADALGYVYVGGAAASFVEGRAIQNLNGRLVGAYAGDMNVCVLDPSYTSRMFWGTFSTQAQGSGSIVGFGIRDNVVAALGNCKGTMYTGSSPQNVWTPSRALLPNPFSPSLAANSPLNDSYLASWYQDIWNQSRQDTLEPRVNPSNPVIGNQYYNDKADFSGSPTVVCVGQPVTFSNTSVGDSTGHRWSFGLGASLLPGTTGRGPFSVSYSSPGYKTVKLELILRKNRPDYVQKAGYINVLPAQLAIGAITGPTILCGGSEVIYSIAALEGVGRYVWEFPAGFTVLDGQNGPTVRVLSGTSGGSISVYGVTPCGNTAPATIQIRVNSIPTQPSVLFLVGRKPLQAGDQAAYNRLAQNYIVDDVVDSLSTGAMANCATFVYIAPSCRRNAILYKFRDVGVPVICAQPFLFPFMGLTNGASTNAGQVSGSSVNITNNTHELAGSLPTGTLPIYLSNNQVNWGTPGAAAIVIASNPASLGNQALFGYEQGWQMQGLTAPARRVAFFADQPGQSSFTPIGQTLFDRAVCWAVRSCTNAVTITTSPLASVSYCPGDTILVPFTKTGTFNSGSIPPTVSTITIDNQDDLSQTSWGWTVTSAVSGYTGRDYVRSAAADLNRFVGYYPQIPFPGLYNVSMSFPRNASFSASARVAIQHALGSDTVEVNQTTGSGYVSLGNYRFLAGQGNFVRVLGKGRDNRTTVADVVRFSPVTLDPVDANRFSAELSNPLGSFAPARVLGLLPGNESGTIRAIIPADVLLGSRYRIRVSGSNPSEFGNDNGTDISIGGNPPPPGPIRGPSEACQGTSVLTFSIDPTPGITQYYWVTPLGTSIQGAPPESANQVTGTATSIRVEFGTATTNEIKVYSRNRCGQSQLASRLLVNLTGLPPAIPTTIAGPDTICLAQVPTYTVSPVPGALRYQWVLSSGATTTDTTTNATLNLARVPDNTLLQIQVRAIGACGSGPYQSRNVLISSTAARARLGAITAQAGACPGVASYTVPPLQAATGYQWILPAGARGTSITNQIDIVWDVATTATLKVVATTACGTSDTARLTINVPTPGRRAMLYVRAPASLTGADNSMKAALEAQNYAVTIFGPTNAINASTYCFQLIVVSPSVTNADNVRRLSSLAIPLMASGVNSQVDDLDLARGRGTSTLTTIRVVNATHPIGFGQTIGLVDIYPSTTNLSWITPGPAAVKIAVLPTDTSRSTVFCYEPGTLMSNGATAPARRVGFFMGTSGLVNLTAAGTKLFARSLCWLTNSCIDQTSQITTTSLNTQRACPGGQIQVPYTIQGTFTASNRFVVQLSDRSGNFAGALQLVGSATGSASGTVTATLPDSITGGTGYRVRVVSTDPAIVGPAATATLSIDGIPSTVSLLGATACPGTGSQVRLIASQPGVSYQPILNGAPTGSPLIGTGDTLTITFTAAQLTRAIDTVRVRVTAGTCPARTLQGFALILVRRAPDTLATLTGSRICPGQDAILTLSRTESGVEYQPIINGTPTGATIAGTGGILSITLPAASLGGGQPVIRLQARIAGCGWFRLQDTATIRQTPSPNLGIIAVDDSICAQSSTVLTLRNTQAGYVYYTFLPAVDSLRATGSTVQFPITTGPTGVRIYRFAVSYPGCRPVPVPDSAIIYTLPPPSPSAQVLAPSLACRGQEVVLKIFSAQAEATYLPYIGTTSQPISAQLQRGDTLLLSLPTAGWAVGANRIRLVVRTGGCRDTFLTIQPTITLSTGPQTAFTVSTTRACYGAQATVILSGSEAGQWYWPSVNGLPAADSLLGTGSAITFNLYPSAADGSVVFVSSRSAGCGVVLQADTAVLRIAAIPTDPLSLISDTLCRGQGLTVANITGQIGVTYYLTQPSGTVLAQATTTPAGSVSFSISGTQLYQAGRFAVMASRGGCARIQLGDTIRYTIKARPQVAYTLTGGAACPGEQATIRLSGSEAGLTYLPLVAGQSAGQAVFGTGSPLVLTLDAGLPAGSIVRVRISDQVCGDTLLVDTAALRLRPTPTGRLAGPDTLSACPGSDFIVRLSRLSRGAGYSIYVDGTLLRDTLSTDTTLTVRIPSALLLSGRPAMVRLAIGTGSCGRGLGLDSTLIRISAAPADSARLTAAPYCPSGPATITLTGQAGIRYYLRGPRGTADSVLGTGAAVQISIPRNLLTGLADTFRIQARSGSCPRVAQAAFAILSPLSPPRATLRLSPDTACGGDTIFAYVDTTVSGTTYSIRSATGRLLASQAGQGSPIRFIINSTDLPSGLSQVILIARLDGCPDSAVARAPIYVRGQINLAVSARPDTVCPGQPARIVLAPTVPGIRYTLLTGAGQRVVGGTAVGTSLSLVVPAVDIQPRDNRLAINLQATGCEQRNADTLVSIYQRAAPDSGLQVIGSSTCLADSATIRIVEPQPGYRYTPLLRNVPLSSASFVIGDTLLIKIAPLALTRDSNLISIRATGICGSTVLAIPVLVLRQTPKRYFATIETADSLVCLNTIGKYTIPLDFIANPLWRTPKEAEATISPDGRELQLRYTAFPPERDTLLFTADLACGGQLIARRRLIKDPDCIPLFIPNIFTPSTTDPNSVWAINGLLPYPNFILQVYNTWGAKVYEAKNSYTPWEGKSGGAELPSATYYYVLDLGDDSKPLTGSITIFR